MHSRTKAALKPKASFTAAGMTRAFRIEDGQPAPELYAANEEPRLDDLLADPLTRALMASDGLPHDIFLAELEQARSRLTTTD